MFTCVLGRYVDDDEDDLGLNVLGCRVDILGTNCNELPQSCWYPKPLRRALTASVMDSCAEIKSAPSVA